MTEAERVKARIDALEKMLAALQQMMQIARQVSGQTQTMGRP